jgi:hypothetical protein
MFAWLESRSRWSKLRDLGQSNLVRASVLMPVFGYLLLLNEHVHTYLTIQYDADGLGHYLPPTWRVWMLFYGSFLLALGSMLFAWWCPAQIKLYASEFQMADTERPHLTAHNLTHQIADKIKALYDSMSDWEDSIFEMPRLKPDLDNLGAGTSQELQTSDQWGLGLIHIWRVSDIKHPKLRILILVLFRVGIVLLTVPAIVTFLQVTILLTKHLLTRI